MNVTFFGLYLLRISVLLVGSSDLCMDFTRIFPCMSPDLFLDFLLRVNSCAMTLIPPQWSYTSIIHVQLSKNKLNACRSSSFTKPRKRCGAGHHMFSCDRQDGV